MTIDQLIDQLMDLPTSDQVQIQISIEDAEGWTHKRTYEIQDLAFDQEGVLLLAGGEV